MTDMVYRVSKPFLGLPASRYLHMFGDLEDLWNLSFWVFNGFTVQVWLNHWPLVIYSAFGSLIFPKIWG